MAHGGRRTGAGRKKGSECKKTQARRAIIDKAMSEGISPLDVMLTAMRQHYQDGDIDRAAEIARDAAPYCTPRLSAIAHKNIDEVPPDFSFLIETVDEHGNTIAVPPTTPASSGTNELPAE